MSGERPPRLEYALPEQQESGWDRYARRAGRVVWVGALVLGVGMVFVALWVWVAGIVAWVFG